MKAIPTSYKDTMRAYLTTLIKNSLPLLVIIIVTVGTLHGLSLYYFPRVSSIQRIKTLPLLGDVTRKTPELYTGVVILTDEDGKGFCSGSVIDNNYAVTAAHCLVGEHGVMTTKPLKVRTSEGSLIDVNAKAAAINTRVDVALIVGDFRSFKLVPAEYRRVIPVDKAELITCGYPEVSTPIQCMSISDAHYQDFQVTGRSQLFPGMSGGPVFAKTKEGALILVAVNTAVYFKEFAAQQVTKYDGNYIIVSPILGLQGMFDIY